MKYILFGLLIGLFLVGMVSAGIESVDSIKDKDYINNIRTTDTLIEDGHLTKEYISNERRLIITSERKWWDLLGIWTEESLLDISLESDYEVAVMSKPDALIAWFNLTDFLGDDLVNNIKFYDVNDNYKELNKEYKFKYQNESNDWIEFNLLSELPNKNIKIGLFTDISFGDKIEWIIEKDGFEILEWALVKGTNAGFVTVAPSADPDGSTQVTIDDKAWAFKNTAPTGATKVTEIGWYANGATEEANFEVGIYDHNVGDNNPEAVVGALSQTNAKGTTAGWKKVTGLNIPITAGTIYWIAIQLDDTATGTNVDAVNKGGEKNDRLDAPATLPDPWGITDTTLAQLHAIYALVEIPETTPPNITINNPISRDYKISSLLFNITVVDATQVDSCWYTLNLGITNYSMTNITSEYTHTNSTIGEGVYTNIFYCNDTLGNEGSSSIQFAINNDYTYSSTTFSSAISGATWMDDGIDITLTENTDYTLTGATFTITNINYAWAGINASWDYETTTKDAETLVTNVTTGVGSFFTSTGTVFAILIVVVIILAIAIIISVVNRFGNSNPSSSGGISFGKKEFGSDTVSKF